MSEKTTFFKVDRNILNWRWWGDEKTLKFWIYCLAKANVTAHDYQSIKVKRGQFVSSYQKMEEESGLSVSNIRTAIKRLKSTGEMTVTKYPKFSLFTVVKYNSYQDNRQGNRQASNREVTGNRQQYKNDKNILPLTGERARACACARTRGKFQNVILSDEEYNKLEKEYPVLYAAYIDKLSCYMAENNKTYKNHYATLVKWIMEDENKNRPDLPSYATYDLSAVDKLID